MDANPRDVVDFWFGAEGSPERGRPRPEWFRKDPAFDAAIRARFGDAVEAALAGAFADWDAAPDRALARVLLLDQFTRNIFRDTPRAFAGDAQALVVAEAAVARGFDRALDPLQRWFLYLPYEHAEGAAMQRRSLALFEALARETGRAEPLEWARRHADVIFRFGRYPHRNEVLGRASTPEEVAFLREPGSRF